MSEQKKEIGSLRESLEVTNSATDDLRKWVEACESSTAYLAHFHHLQHQKKLRNNITISRMPYSADEKIDDIIFSICSLVGIELCAEDIVAAYRNRNRRMNQIIVEFSSLETKDAVILVRHDKEITVADLFPDSNCTDRIFINSHVLPYLNHILQYGRKLVRERRIFACFMSSLGVSVRVNEGGDRLTAYSCSHLDQILRNARNKKQTQKRK